MLFRNIINRLIRVDHILLIRKDSDDSNERVLMVHPNYDVDADTAPQLDELDPEDA